MTTDPHGAALLPDVAPINFELDGRLSFESALRLPRHLDLSFDAFLVGEGWHGVEQSGSRFFQWMGRQMSASVELAIDRSVALVAELEVYMAIEPHYRDALQVRVDDDPAPLALRRDGDVIVFDLPLRERSRGKTVLWIDAGPGTVRSPDPRSLSLACSRLQVRPAVGQPAAEERLVLESVLSDIFAASRDLWPLHLASASLGAAVVA